MNLSRLMLVGPQWYDYSPTTLVKEKGTTMSLTFAASDPRSEAGASAMPTDKMQIKFYAQREDLRDALKRAASDDQRSASVLIERILIDWLVDRGYLAKSPTKPKRETRK
jgi:hypothetical protein